MLLKALFFSSLVLCAACATEKSFDKDKTNPAYYEGTGVPISDSTAIKTPQSDPNTLPPQNNKAGDAVGGLIGSGATLAAYPDYYKTSTIRGTCLINGGSALENVPCRRVHMALLDEQGVVIGRTEANNSGQFAFFVKKDKTYHLKITDSQLIVAPTDPISFSMGDEVTLHANLRERK